MGEHTFDAVWQRQQLEDFLVRLELQVITAKWRSRVEAWLDAAETLEAIVVIASSAAELARVLAMEEPF